jgi:hypothetical protein
MLQRNTPQNAACRDEPPCPAGDQIYARRVAKFDRPGRIVKPI